MKKFIVANLLFCIYLCGKDYSVTVINNTDYYIAYRVYSYPGTLLQNFQTVNPHAQMTTIYNNWCGKPELEIQAFKQPHQQNPDKKTIFAPQNRCINRSIVISSNSNGNLTILEK